MEKPIDDNDNDNDNDGDNNGDNADSGDDETCPPVETVITTAAVEDGTITYAPLFEIMTNKHFIPIFMFLLPILWAICIGIGWSMEDKVETEVYNIWTRQRSSFAKDVEYAAEYDRDSLGATSFAAMAIARDGGNLFTIERLEEIRLRMEETEATTVEYKGNTFTWDDVCSSNNIGPGTAYKFPCVRLSPIDFFQEARWFFQEEDRHTWYKDFARKLVVAPRIPRFGIMQGVCSNLTLPTGRTECDATIVNRMIQGEPMMLFADIGNLENNHPCKQCIEEEYETTMTTILGGATQVFQGLIVFATQTEQTDLAENLTTILSQLDRQAIIDFYSYYVTRSLYISLGTSSYMTSRDQFQMAISGCMNPGSTTPCPGPTTLEEATVALASHADHTFSSTVTSGNPLPNWGDDGEGFLLQGTSPVGGSGIDLSGDLFSSVGFLQAPDAANWEALVESDPIYAWFMASVSPMTAHCGNGFLKGTSGMGDATDAVTNGLMIKATQQWCTKYNVPFEDDAEYTVQHFARMWFDLLVDSPSFLSLIQGKSDPYVWTTGQGCGYSLAGTRYSYTTSTSQEELMGNASGELYFIDEGESVGAIDRNLLMGGRIPQEYSLDTPLEVVSVTQSIYPALTPDNIITRVQNCNRPAGSVLLDLEDAEEILFRFKEKLENAWTRGWDDSSQGNVSFVGFFDDTGVIGTTGRMLEDITLDNTVLVIVSIVIIAVFSVLFVVSSDIVESRITITVFGVALVILAFFAAVGFGLIIGIKINITIAWTLPFVMLGLGVDDMYIVLLSIREQPGYSSKDFLAAMKEVMVPISMTSLVNAGMFAIMNINDVPAIYLTAQVALLSVVFLYLTVVFCFSTWCYLDMKRQSDNRYDFFVCLKSKTEHREKQKMWASVFYDKVYRPLLLDGAPAVVALSHSLIWTIAAVLMGLGIWGLTENQREVGLGLEDFFPQDNQASRWATMRTEELASWSIQMNWGANDYEDPRTQMRIIKQFEDVVNSAYVAEVDTDKLWLADFAVWTTYQCTENFGREDPDIPECGRNQVYPVNNSTCMGSWVPNTLGLREKVFADVDTCVPFSGGVCRPTDQMHPDDIDLIDENIEDSESWCPVVKGWSDQKMGFCLGKWRELAGGGGRLVLENITGTPMECEGEFKDDEMVTVPIPISVGPTMFAFDLFSHQITIDMIEETRSICDDDPEIHCWLTGIPYNYWSQYIGIFSTFWEIGGTAIATGFVVSFAFLMCKFWVENRHSTRKIVVGSLVGASLIALTTIMSLVCVSGLSALNGVAFTGFSTMSFVLSVGFAVEYSVHVVARWLLASNDLTTSVRRVEHAMEFLFLPTFMSFVSSTVGVVCLAFTEFEFNEVFFFRPLLIVMLVTYFFGCWWLPVFLTLLDFDQVKFGMETVEVKSLVKDKAGDDELEEVSSTGRHNASDSNVVKE